MYCEKKKYRKLLYLRRRTKKKLKNFLIRIFVGDLSVNKILFILKQGIKLLEALLTHNRIAFFLSKIMFHKSVKFMTN